MRHGHRRTSVALVSACTNTTTHPAEGTRTCFGLNVIDQEFPAESNTAAFTSYSSNECPNSCFAAALASATASDCRSMARSCSGRGRSSRSMGISGGRERCGATPCPPATPSANQHATTLTLSTPEAFCLVGHAIRTSPCPLLHSLVYWTHGEVTSQRVFSGFRSASVAYPYDYSLSLMMPIGHHGGPKQDVSAGGTCIF